jgi:hypothetical protein
MSSPKKPLDSNTIVPILVAVITLAGGLGVAVFNNWDKLFPPETPVTDGRANGGENFQTVLEENNKDCHQICRADNGICLGAIRSDGQSVDCDFKGVKSSNGFVLRAKRCLCQRN